MHPNTSSSYCSFNSSFELSLKYSHMNSAATSQKLLKQRLASTIVKTFEKMLRLSLGSRQYTNKVSSNIGEYGLNYSVTTFRYFSKQVSYTAVFVSTSLKSRRQWLGSFNTYIRTESDLSLKSFMRISLCSWLTSLKLSAMSPE